MAFRRFSYSAANPRRFLVTGTETRSSSSSVNHNDNEISDEVCLHNDNEISDEVCLHNDNEISDEVCSLYNILTFIPLKI